MLIYNAQLHVLIKQYVFIRSLHFHDVGNPQEQFKLIQNEDNFGNRQIGLEGY